MAAALVESPVTGIGTGTNSATATLGITSTAGELIVVEVTTGGVGTTPSSVTDNLSQTYTKVLEVTGIVGGHESVSLWYKEGSAAGVTSVTANFNTGAGDTIGSVQVLHYTGMATSGALDQNSGTPSSASTPWSSASITTTVPDTVCVAGVFM